MLELITGGSGSGKSEYAEQEVQRLGAHRIYIATMYPFDRECELRIERHRNMRSQKNFETIECYTGLKSIQVEEDAVVLLECMSNLTANEIYQPKGVGRDGALAEIMAGIRKLTEQARHVVIVTNEVFSDGVCYDRETEQYLQILGKINCQIAELADRVVEVVYSIPVERKGRQK